MSNKSSLENNFQNYVEAVKQRQMTWNIFQNSVEDFSHSDIYRLKLFNAILLTELTTNYSDLDRLKYLNIILLTEFRNHIQRIQIQSMVELENEQTDNGQNSGQIDQDMNDGVIRRKSINSDDIEIPLVKVEEVENSNQKMGDLEIEEQNLRIDKSNRVPISADCDIQSSINDENIVNDDFESSIETFQIEHIEDDQNLINYHDDMNDERIKCEICGKVFKTKILLKNHFGTDNGEYVTCNNFVKTFQTKTKLERPIKIVDDDSKDHKFRSCGKFFTHAQSLVRHIKTVHKGHKQGGKGDLIWQLSCIYETITTKIEKKNLKIFYLFS